MKTTYTQKSNAKRAAKAIATKFESVVKEVKTIESVAGMWVNFVVLNCAESRMPEGLAERAHQFIFEPVKLVIKRVKMVRRTVVQAVKAEGIKIQKDREERNGIKRPSVGGKCAQLWAMFEAHYAETGMILTPKPAKEISAKEGLDPTTTTVQLYRWRDFMGF